MPNKVIIGFDPSLNNWGYAVGLLDTELTIIETGVFQNKNKPMKPKNLQDYNRCKELYTSIIGLIDKHQPDHICIELPTGSKSSRAMVSYAVCIALSATLGDRVVVTLPMQTKKLVGALEKSEIISWVKDKHPYLDLSIKSKAEHIADAICAIYIGMNL